MPDWAEQLGGSQRVLGDYRLKELLTVGQQTWTFHAEQISVERDVVLECIKSDITDQEVIAHFIADVRAKATVDHPGIGSVFEAIHEADSVYYTRELLPGRNLEELHALGTTYAPPVIAGFLRQIASAMEYLEQRKVDSLPLEPRHLVCRHEVVRLGNLAVAEPVARVEGHDRLLLAELMLDLLERGAAGATRTTKLLTMMLQEEGKGLTWTQIKHTARSLEQDLHGARALSETQHLEGVGAQSSFASPRALIVGGSALLVLVAALLWWKGREHGVSDRLNELSEAIEVPAGNYPTYGGSSVSVPAFSIDAHEVSIAEYEEFLKALAALPEAGRSLFDHPDQPRSKKDHYPFRWDELLEAAEEGTQFGGETYSMYHPVTGVDWWDAQAYARWKGGRLPTQAEWFAAARSGEVNAVEFGAVDQLDGDVTEMGVHGMAGNVSEWIEDLVKNPAFPIYPKGPIACGGSYLKPRNGVEERTWLPNREARRHNLGFRVVVPVNASP